LFPGTTVPSSALIISLFSLFGLGNSDRFSVGYAIMRCILVDRPWDCTPSNALEELFWDPAPTKLFPRARKPNTFWLKELDFQAHGTNLLWRLVTENSDIKQLQRNPLFPYDPVTNPILHELPPPNTDIREMLLLAVEVLLQLWGQYKLVIFTTLAGIPAVLLGWLLTRTIRPGLAPLMWKWPVLGLGLDFNRDPVSLVQKGMEGHRAMVFGIDLPNQQQFVIHTAQDMDVITRDGPYERLFSLREFLRSIGFDLIVGSANFESDFHTNLIREHLLNPLILQGFSRTVAHASHQFFIDRPLVPPSSDSHHYDSLNATLDQYIAYVMSRCFAGLNDFDNQALIDLFIKFNADAVKAMGFSTFLPKFLRFLARMPITKDFEAIRKILMPPIARARQRLNENNVKDTNFLNFILPRITDDAEASDMVAILVFVGLTNLQATLSSCVLDIINRNGFQSHIIASLAHANENNISSQRNQPWQTLRSAALESIRLSGPATGPARQLKKSWRYPSSASLSIPAGKAVALSAWYRHREAVDFGGDAAEYKPDRFMTSDPTIGGNQFISWGLNTKHMCPGRWFALQSIQLMVKALLEQYEFVPDKVLTDAEKYKYSGGSVVRTPVGVTVIPRYAT
jgi:peroxidase